MKKNWHKTAVIDPKAEIDAEAEIGPYCIIGRGVKIAKGVKLHSHVVIDGDTEIGEGTSIYPFASIGLPPQDIRYNDEPTKVVIGKNNTIREYVTIHRASAIEDGITKVGDGNFLMAYVHIAHNCKVGNHITMANVATLAGHVEVEDYAVIGGLAAAHQHTRIGRYAMVGGLSGIAQDIPPYMIAAGSRAKLFGPNTIGLKRHGFSENSIKAIKKAYRLIFREKLTLNEAIKKVLEEFPNSPEIKHLIEFIQKNKRGISR